MRSSSFVAFLTFAAAVGLGSGCRGRPGLEAEVRELREEVILVRWELDRLREDMWIDGAKMATLVAESREILGLPPGASLDESGSAGCPRAWDPPAALGHLPDTPAGMRTEIDKLVDALFDPYAGRDSLDARERLISIGKPAFPRVLGRMAKTRDEITDIDSHDERLQESSLKLADETLRGMDGWLTAKGKTPLQPGCDKEYVAYICRLHYKRWLTKLRIVDEMPGPFDPSRPHSGDVGECG